MVDYVLEMKGIVKTFPGVKALKGVDFKVQPGEIHALMGENGAGKSTLIKVLTGLHTKDSGEIIFEGQAVNPSTPLEAEQIGISTIYQELNLIPHLTIYENIYLGREPKKGSLIDWKREIRDSQKLLNDIGLEIDVKQKLGEQSTAVQQMVAISRALAVNAQLVVMDEPTSSLDKSEVKLLFNVINRLKEQGIAVIFISHRFEEIYEICDRVTILKDGDLEGDYDLVDLPELKLIEKMVGREIEENREIRQSSSNKYNEAVCSLINASTAKLKDVNLEINRGEIVGLAGLLGSGRSEIGTAIFGADMLDKGQIKIDENVVKIKSLRQTIARGFALIPEDRRVSGIIPNMSVKDNISLANFSNISKSGVISKKKQDEIANKYIADLQIKTPTPDQAVKLLSGGNQQKVILARWLCTNPRLIILDEPTRGIDIGAKAEVENLIGKLADDGISVLLISSDMPELIRNSDRIVVLNDGNVMRELVGEEMTQDNIMKAITEKNNKIDS